MSTYSCSELSVAENRKEIQLHGTPDFPCAAYLDCYTDQPGNTLPWHWHEELEFLCVTQGALKLQLPNKLFYLEEGDFFAANSSILHCAEGFPSCKLECFVFSPQLITGNDTSVYARNYIRPLLSCSAFTGFHLKADTCPEILAEFKAAYQAQLQALPGYEFFVREHLSHICLFLCQQYDVRPEMISSTSLNPDTLRSRQMLDWIQNHYAEHLTLADIAAAAGIGEREALRCFRRTFQLSPIQYLLKYRILQGAELLIHEPAKSISQIAIACGFDSPSNFSSLFRRTYFCSPREYRLRYAEQT